MLIPSDIKRFLSKYIGSVQQLEVLLAVASDPARDWSVEEIGRKANLDLTATTNRLLSLCVKGLISANETPVRTFRYRSEDVVMDIMVQKLKSLYAQKPTMLIEFIYSRMENRLRDFSDAFRLDQGEDDY